MSTLEKDYVSLGTLKLFLLTNFDFSLTLTLESDSLTYIFSDFDLGDVTACLRYYAGWADKITGQTIEGQ